VLTTSKTDDELQNVLHYENIITSRLSRDASGSITFFLVWINLFIYKYTKNTTSVYQLNDQQMSEFNMNDMRICILSQLGDVKPTK